MQLDSDLTQQTETVRLHQCNLKGENCTEACPVASYTQRETGTKTQIKQISIIKNKSKCGNSSYHFNIQYTAKGVTCHTCGEKGHYRQVCASKAVHKIKDVNSIFLDSLPEDTHLKVNAGK